jgi:hypothetical protein
VEYAQIILALDELTGLMKTDWKVKVDTKNKTEMADVSWGPARVKAAVQPTDDLKKESPVATPKAKKVQAAKGFSIPNPKDKTWLLVIKDLDSYKAHYREFPNNSYFYDPKTNIVSAQGLHENLAEVHVEEAWQEIYFEMAVEQLSARRCTVTVNEKAFNIGPSVHSARNGVPIRIIYLPQEQTAKLFVGTVVAAEINVFEPNWNRNLKFIVGGGAGGHSSAIKIRNIYIRKAAE